MSNIIAERVRRICSELPGCVQLVAAAKLRQPAEILEAVAAGVRIIGENYVQEAEKARAAVGGDAAWHFIGRLQKNKAGKAVALFDMIETVDSFELAAEIDKRSAQAGKVMPVLVEINSGRESQKGGVLPENAENMVARLATLKNIRVMGLMTMGPSTDDEEIIRGAFAATRQAFERIKALGLPGVEMKHLSMGMSDSYKIAIEEGANIVRIGTGIFGERPGRSIP
jgi:pyridoxal phosphate enzyme (YggS family)